MNAHKPAGSAKVESVIRGMLGLLLLAAVVWALADGNGEAPSFALGSLRIW